MPYKYLSINLEDFLNNKDGSVVGVSASHAMSWVRALLGSYQRPSYKGTNTLPAWHAGVLLGFRLCSKRPGSVWNCLWGHALKNLRESIARVGYCIPVPDFYI